MENYQMKENLKVTHYRNGDEIPNITNNDDDQNEEQYVIEAMKIAYCELDTIIEPSGVIGLAMLLKDKFIPTGDNTIVVLSGGNIDPSKHQDLIK